MTRRPDTSDTLSDPAFYPGPQKEIRRVLSAATFLKVLVGIVCLLFVQSVVRENHPELRQSPFTSLPARLLSIQILDNKSAATLLVGLISVAFINRQVTLAYRPVFNYRSQQTSTSTFALPKSQDNGNFWAVSLQNVSSGPAIAVKSSYRAVFGVDGPGEYGPYDDVIRKLTAGGLTNGQTFVIRPISRGWCLAAKDECIIFEAALPSALGLHSLDIKIEFQGLLGDEYTKEVFCIPRMGIYPNKPPAPAAEI